ncbi:MAG: glycosyltransferase family 4 protein [PVC group bacterium]|nr:glycosyltransferase family 4 protein [PVC group bacterium]
MKVVLASHVWVTGPCHEIKKYILRRDKGTLLYITHPLYYHDRLNGSGYELYSDGKLVREQYNKIRKIPEIINYFSAFFRNILYVFRTRESYDVYIGFNNLNALAGWFLKKIGKVNRCVYHVVDYTPQRFDNKLLNFIYHRIESFCAVHCDETWNLSGRMVDAREHFKGLRRELCGVQKVVPMGIWDEEMVRFDFESVHKTQLVFMGHLLKKNGVQFVLDAVPLIIEKIPKFTFLVIGDGEYLGKLKAQVSRLKIDKCVRFAGYVEDHAEIERMIAKSALAIALYESGNKEKNWTYYTDPGKIKVYLGSGVPVLLSDVPPNAREIEKEQCGKIVDLAPKDIAAAVVLMLQDPELLRIYRKNALAYSKQFDWQKMLDKAFIFDNNHATSPGKVTCVWK